MSADQEGAEEVWVQTVVVANSVQHYSKPQLLGSEDTEKFQGLAEMVANIERNGSGHVAFEIEAGDGWTYIPTRNIDYITIMKVSAPE